MRAGVFGSLDEMTKEGQALPFCLVQNAELLVKYTYRNKRGKNWIKRSDATYLKIISKW